VKMDVATLSAITADCGTLTAGTINGVTIYAGGGNVKVSATGIDVKGEYCYFRDTAGTYRGGIIGTSSGLTLVSQGGNDIILIPGSNYVRPPDGVRNLGAVSYPWSKFYVSEIYIKNSGSTAPVIIPYAHKYGWIGTSTRAFDEMWADDFWECSPKPYESPSYLKELEKMKWDKETRLWDYKTLPHKLEKEREGFSLGSVASYLLLAMTEVKERLEALEGK